MTKVKVFGKEGQWSEVQGHDIKWKVLPEIIHIVKYESPTTYQSKIMTKVKVLKKKVKLQSQRSEGQGHDINWKVSPEGMHMWNMKALAPTNQKLQQRLKFLLTDRQTNRQWLL
jgi:hypothetical protein